MAFGVLPPFNPLLVTKAFFDALCTMDTAYVSFSSVVTVPSRYTFAENAIKSDHADILCEKSFTILGSAANNYLEVPAAVASDYIHALRVLQGIMYGYDWPYPRTSPQLILKDEEHSVIILLFGLMYDIPGAKQCLVRMGAEGPVSEGNITWEAEAVGELRPIIEKISYQLGEIIRQDCLNGTTEANLPERQIKLLSHYEQTFLNIAFAKQGPN